MSVSAAAITSAHAGAFAVREQSAYFQGMSFAGAAAGDELSSMFWNSAAAAAVPGMNTESSISLVIPQSEIVTTNDSLLHLLNPASDTHSGNIGDPTAVPASYANYQWNDRLFFGLATNSQYGFKTKPDHLDFAGTPIARTSDIFSINFNPNVAYKLTPELTLGVGAQIMYAKVRLGSDGIDLTPVGGGPLPGRTDKVDDWAFGATAGVIWKPAQGTSIGVGYRSAIQVNAEGKCSGAGLSNVAADPLDPTGCLVPGGAHVTTDLTLPDLVTASIRQRASDRLTLLGTVEWTNWSRVGAEAKFKNSDGKVVDVFPLGYDDGWFFSAGAEYAWSDATTLRAGIGYEISPISDDVRTVALPDNDRIWLSVGASTKLTDRITVDLAYSHLFVKDSPIETFSSTGAPLLVAEASGDIDIVSASLKYHWGESEPELEPLK